LVNKGKKLSPVVLIFGKDKHYAVAGPKYS